MRFATKVNIGLCVVFGVGNLIGSCTAPGYYTSVVCGLVAVACAITAVVLFFKSPFGGPGHDD